MGLAAYYYGGGKTKDLPRHLRRLRDRAGPALDKGRDAVREAAESAQDLPERPPLTEKSRIAVYFAPCHPLNPSGVDDHLVRLLKGAERSIFCAFYDLQLAEVADVLVARRKAGVEVGIVTDSAYSDRDALVQCVEAGIPVVFDEREPFMHNKFCIVDGKRVWTGSTNITENGMFRNNNNALLIESGQLAVNFTAEFDEMFRDKRFGGRSPKNTRFPELSVDVVSVECYFAPEDGVQGEIIDEIDDAREHIDFMAFAFTSREIANAMAARMKKGVRVRGLFETRNAASKYSRAEFLAEQGAEIHLDTNEYTMHHKVIVVDGATTVTGSYNFSSSAEERNDENVLIIHSKRIAELYAAEFERLTSR